MPWKTEKAQDIGGRAEQQDRVEIFASPGGERHLLVVADGMGGHRDGALAAEAVLAAARNCFEAVSTPEPQQLLGRICLDAHRAILGIDGSGERTPGSTCALLYLEGREAYWAYVGDSRVYHFQEDGFLVDRTRDHSLVELMLSQGHIEAGDPDARALRNQLYMRLGGDSEPEPNFGATAVNAGDLFLVCSDGLWSPAEGDDLLSGAEGQDADPALAERLVAWARAAGGADADNISLALARWYPEEAGGLKGLLQRAFSRPGKGRP